MMSMNWNYPTTIWFGDQRINEIQKACESLNIQKPLIVTDPGILKTDIIEKINSSLNTKQIYLAMFSQTQLEIMLNLEFHILIQMLMME